MTDGRRGIHVQSKIGIFGKRWYFAGKAKNSEIVMQSEGYNSREAVYNGIRATAELFGPGYTGGPPIYENGIQMDAFGRPMKAVHRRQ